MPSKYHRYGFELLLLTKLIVFLTKAFNSWFSAFNLSLLKE